MKTFQFLLAILGFASFIFAQDVPIFLDGAFDGATVDNATVFNSGGTISVNGWTVIVPNNTLVVFPAAYVPWRDFVAGQSALAGFEVTVVGNIVNGVPMAGQIAITQHIMNLNRGYIEEINFDGSMKIRNGPIIRINDPNAIYSAGYTAAPFMTADDQNPSITAFSGFPMCVPRNESDPLCPQSQRPNVPGTNSPQGTIQAVDPLVMAPFKVGDFVDYIGFKSSNGEIICYNIVATNVQITTTGAPTYIRMEDALIGVFTTNNNAEVADNRFIGYTSELSATVTVHAMDLDPCTGAVTDRLIGVAGLEDPQRNKWMLRRKDASRQVYTRDYRMVASTGTVRTKNGLLAGQYVQPVTEWIQPELTAPGAEPIPHDFSQMDFLTKGVGIDEDGNIWGALAPFPQSGVTTRDPSEACVIPPPADPQTPVAAISGRIRVGSSGSTGTQEETAEVTLRNDDTLLLSGSQLAANFSASDLTYLWSITEDSPGSASQLAVFTGTNNTEATMRFGPTPPVGAYTIKLSITSAANNKTGTATIRANLFSGPDAVTVQSYTWTNRQSGTLAVTCRSNYKLDSRVGMTLEYTTRRGTTSVAMSANPTNSGTWAFSSRNIDQPTSITCRSLAGGFATTSQQTAARRRALSARF